VRAASPGCSRTCRCFSVNSIIVHPYDNSIRRLHHFKATLLDIQTKPEIDIKHAVLAVIPQGGNPAGDVEKSQTLSFSRSSFVRFSGPGWQDEPPKQH